jgi:hypothetical protein
MWDGRGDACEPVDVPARPAISYHLGPRWPLWLALVPLVGLLGLGALVVISGFGSISVLEAPIVPRTPVLTLPPPSAPPSASPPVASSLGPTPEPPPPIAAPAASTVPTTILASPPVDDLPPRPPSSFPSASPSTTTSEPPPSVPRSTADCQSDGWRSLVDDEGRPFANQGQCIRFVERAGQHP